MRSLLLDFMWLILLSLPKSFAKGFLLSYIKSITTQILLRDPS